METTHPTPFASLPPTPRAHFRLNFYAVVYHLISYLRRLGQANGGRPEHIVERYPFLASYYDELRPYLPEQAGWDEMYIWWEAAIQGWEAGVSTHLPLCALAAQGSLDFKHRMVLLLVGLVEEDSRFGTLFADLQAPLNSRRPCMELVGQILRPGRLDAQGDLWEVCRPLLSTGLLQATQPEAPRAEWELRVPSQVWEAIRGGWEADQAAQLAPGCQYHPGRAFPGIETLVLPAALQAHLLRLPPLLASGSLQTVLLRGTQGSNRLEVAGSLAQRMGRGLLALDTGALHAERLGPFLGILCTLTNSLPAIQFDPTAGETADLPELALYSGPVIALLGMQGGLSGKGMQRSITLSLPLPSIDERRCLWAQAFAGAAVEGLEEIASRFLIPAAHIRQAAGVAIAQASLEGRQAVCPEDVRVAARSLNRQHLDTLALYLESWGDWEHLVVSPLALHKLYGLEQRIRHREALLDHLGVAFGNQQGRGVRSLFTGASGTGKTLAARILAARLGMDLYRVDLAAVVDKYIGETEKKLHHLLSVAEDLDVILLLDEGDALLGRRTEVRTANDRYANLETNYLLQRLETYQGVVIITTNAAPNIDQAFQRRMDVLVDFVAPSPQERWQIWQLHLPAGHTVEPDYLERLAVRCALTGGQIRNAALHASLLALESGGAMHRWHLEQAVQSEYRKAGATYPLAQGVALYEGLSGMDTFLDAFQT